jgi:ribonuclease D
MTQNHSETNLVINSQQLRELVRALKSQPMVAVDTESNSLYAYREQVCLIQFSMPGEDALIDPLALGDISPLAEVFADPRIEKIFHAAEYDLLTLKRDFKFSFSNIFDTMVAARLLGWKKVGLGSILEEVFDIHLEKRYQRANWGKRPLPRDMLDYARLDTHYLIQLRQRLYNELKQKDLLALAKEDFNRLCCLNGNGPEPVLPSIWRMRGVKELTPEQASVLQRLVQYRQQCAEKADRPLFKVFGDKTLVELAAAMPTSLEELNGISGLSPAKIRRYGAGLLNSIKRGCADEPAYPPRRPRFSENHINRLEALREWRKQRARQIDVESDVVLPRDILETLARKNPANRQQLAEIMGDIPWRLEKYGDEIAGIIERQRG